MPILQDKTDSSGRYIKDSVSVVKADPKKDALSQYTPDAIDRTCINEFLKDFRNGWQTMHLPRPEFNDLSLYQRHVVDMLAFNTYQENDGNPMLEDRLGGWRSTAMRPIQRNKAVSIAAHMTARQLVPKIFAYNDQNEEQHDGAQVMGYLVDWAREQANYPFMALYRTVASLYSPISWGYSEYGQVYRNIKDTKVNGVWQYKRVIDEDESGFKHTPISTDQVYFANFYEREVQKQDFIILRRIISYDKAKAKYGHLPNFKFVSPGIVVVMDDANRSFYQVYDPHMRGEDVEECIRWRKSTDSKEIMVNGVLLSEPYAPNPRQDHQYPFDAFYYLPINERCIAGKSLVFALGPESSLLNTQYQMINDGNMLNLFPPTVTTGSDKVGSDVIVPGLNLAFAEKDVQMSALRTADGNSLKVAMEVMAQVEKSIAESSQDPIQQGQNPSNTQTAYQISRIEQNAATVLGLTMKFMANSHVIPYGKLLLSDILQYMTVADAEKITEQGGLIYRTFFAKDNTKGDTTNKIKFDATMPETLTEDQKLDMSYEILAQQGGMKTKSPLYRVNPTIFREYKFNFAIDSDVLNPRSAELERAYSLETYDRAIMNPVADQEQVFKDLLLSTDPKTSRDPSKYVKKQTPDMNPQQPGQDGQPQGGPTGSPIANAKKSPLPQQMNIQ